ncbi:hypothetical protein C1646_663249 [Rhizophagus diaphanus]|nr:hypothetical protein C1646_663249 [Rhizophagus diaphanus] [Rhizophagus sp. MUCL 43196]
MADLKRLKALAFYLLVLILSLSQTPRWSPCGIQLDLSTEILENLVISPILKSSTPLSNNSKLQTLFTNHSLMDINWTYTKLSLTHNDTDGICSSDKSKKDAFKIKCILPCGEILSAHYPSLYTPALLPVKCPLCNTLDNTNQHLGFYPILIQPMNALLRDAKQSLYTRITTEINSFFTNATLSRDLDASELFIQFRINHVLYT